MNAESFTDTNVLVYQLERLDVRKADIADELIERGIAQQIEGVTIVDPFRS